LAFPGHVLDRISALGTPLGRICVDLLTFFAGRYRLAFGFDARRCTIRSRWPAPSIRP
jgi:hypothetical protein